MTDREKLIEILRVPISPHELVDPIEAVADYLLDNGVVVREKGEWKRVDHDGSWHVDKCSICHRRIHYVDYDQPYQFCPNCGADMRNIKEEKK